MGGFAVGGSERNGGQRMNRENNGLPEDSPVQHMAYVAAAPRGETGEALPGSVETEFLPDNPPERQYS